MPFSLKPAFTSGARVTQQGEGAWRLEIPAGPKGKYRLAQLDDYGSMPRRAFPHRAPFRLSLQARASACEIPGTWGFGLWNNPFGMAILRGAELLRLPALPEAAWFFFASPPNYLSFHDPLPAQGWLAATYRSATFRPATFRSVGKAAALISLSIPALPLLWWPPAARWLRRLAAGFIGQDAAQIAVDPTAWHAYELEWQAERCTFRVDGEVALETSIAPRSPLALVIWVDNQYAAFPPSGHLRLGTLPNPEPAWIEVRELQVDED